MHLRRSWDSLNVIPRMSNAERKLRDEAVRQLAHQQYQQQQQPLLSVSSSSYLGNLSAVEADETIQNNSSMALLLDTMRPYTPASTLSLPRCASSSPSPSRMKSSTSQQHRLGFTAASLSMTGSMTMSPHGSERQQQRCPLPRPLMISNVCENSYGGIDADCTAVQNQRAGTSFGVGTRGLGTAGVPDANKRKAGIKQAVEEWSQAKDRWLFQDRIRQTERSKALIARTAGVDHHKHFARGMRQLLELSAIRKIDDAQADKKAWKAEKEQIQQFISPVEESEAAHIKLIRQAAVQAEAHRKEHEQEMLDAAQRLAEIERSTRQIALIERDAIAEMTEITRRRIIRERRAAASATRQQLLTDHSTERQASANKLRKKESQWQRAADGYVQSRQDDNKTLVRTMQKQLKEGKELSLALEERRLYRNRQQIIKERQALEAKREEHTAQHLKELKEKAQSVRDGRHQLIDDQEEYMYVEYE